MDSLTHTVSGREIDVRAFTAGMISIGDIAEQLAKESRFCGSTPGVMYSVAQHSVHVSHIVERMHLELFPDDLEDRRLMCLTGLLHDAPEAYLRDIPSPVKSSPEMAGYKALEDGAWRAVAERFELPEELPEMVKRADLVALATEKRDLMPQTHHETWDILAGVECDARRLIPLRWQDAMWSFMNRYKQLTWQ